MKDNQSNRPKLLSSQRMPTKLSCLALLAAAIAIAGCTPPPRAPSPDGARSGFSSECPALASDPGLTRLCDRSIAQARSDTAKKAILFAVGQLGKPYDTTQRLGPDSYDCSGLVWRSYSEAGIDIGARISSTIITPGMPRLEIAMDQVRPGDIVWHPGHVAIALADGNVIEAAKPGTNVRIASTKFRTFSRAVAISAP